jgi:hypothetical protein
LDGVIELAVAAPVQADAVCASKERDGCIRRGEPAGVAGEAINDSDLASSARAKPLERPETTSSAGILGVEPAVIEPATSRLPLLCCGCLQV